jgi:hypothetical protein
MLHDINHYRDHGGVTEVEIIGRHLCLVCNRRKYYQQTVVKYQVRRPQTCMTCEERVMFRYGGDEVKLNGCCEERGAFRA